jgi:excinuclease ABC subunit A
LWVKVEAQSAQQIVDAVKRMADRTRIQVLAPVITNKKGQHEKVLEEIRKQGFVRVRIDGEVRELDETIELDRYVSHNIEVVVDRLVLRHYDDPESEDAKNAETRLTEAIETALEVGEGVVVINNLSQSHPKIPCSASIWLASTVTGASQKLSLECSASTPRKGHARVARA